MQGVYEKQIAEMSTMMKQLNLKAKEGEEMKRIVGEYRELLKKQEEIINSTKKSRDRVPGLVWNHTQLNEMVAHYETVLSERNKEIKTKNKRIAEMESEVRETTGLLDRWLL